MGNKVFTVDNGQTGSKLEVTYGAATDAQTIGTAMDGVAEIKVFVNDSARKLSVLKALDAVKAKLNETNLA